MSSSSPSHQQYGIEFLFLVNKRGVIFVKYLQVTSTMFDQLSQIERHGRTEGGRS